MVIKYCAVMVRAIGEFRLKKVDSMEIVRGYGGH